MYQIVEYTNNMTLNEANRLLGPCGVRDYNEVLRTKASGCEANIDVIGDYDTLEEAKKNYKEEFTVRTWQGSTEKGFELMSRVIEHEDENGCVVTDAWHELKQEQLEKIYDMVFHSDFVANEVIK